MPNPQIYASIVAGNPAAPTQLYVAIVDANGNIIGSTFTQPQGRLTLTTLVSVLGAPVATAATVFYTPYQGNVVPLYDGTVIQPTQFAELSNVLANSTTGKAGPAAGAASENYDMFVWNDAGTLRLTRGPVWTSAVLRSAGTALVMANGLLLNNAAITNGPAAQRGTYVGTIRTDAGGATVSWSLGAAAAGGTPATVNVWNMYNRANFNCNVTDTSADWNYTSATIRASNNSNGNRVSFVRGLDAETVEATFSQNILTAAVITAFGATYVALDVTTGVGVTRGGLVISRAATTAVEGEATARYVGLPGLGFHFLQACENADGTNAATFRGSSSLRNALNVRLTA